jgi:hypothetical protein
VSTYTAPAPAPAPVTLSEYRVTAERTSLKIGETTTITKKKIYSDQSVVSIGCSITSDTIVTIDTQCTATAVGAGTRIWCWTDSASGKKGCVEFTVSPIEALIQQYRTTGGPRGMTTEYGIGINFTSTWYCNNSGWSCYGGYESHGRNNSDGCAKDISWTVYLRDTNMSLIETDTGSLSGNPTIGPGEVFDVEGCCARNLADRVKSGALTAVYSSFAYTWTDVACF